MGVEWILAVGDCLLRPPQVPIEENIVAWYAGNGLRGVTECRPGIDNAQAANQEDHPDVRPHGSGPPWPSNGVRSSLFCFGGNHGRRHNGTDCSKQKREDLTPRVKS